MPLDITHARRVYSYPYVLMYDHPYVLMYQHPYVLMYHHPRSKMVPPLDDSTSSRDTPNGVDDAVGGQKCRA
jgi:hypothetical protein